MIRDQPVTEASADVVRATPRGRAWTLMLLAVAVMLVACFQWFVFPLIDSALRDATIASIENLKFVFAACILAGLVPALFMIVIGWRVRRHGRFPLPGAWVWRDTSVKRGRAAARIAWLCMTAGAIAALLCIGLTAYAWTVFDRLVPQYDLKQGVVILRESLSPKP